MKHQEIKEIREYLEQLGCVGIRVSSWSKSGTIQICERFDISGKQLSLLAETLKEIQLSKEDIIDFDFNFPEYYKEYFKVNKLTKIAIKFFDCMKYLNYEIIDRFESALGWTQNAIYTIRIHTTEKSISDKILEEL